MNDNTLEKLSLDQRIKLLTGADFWTTHAFGDIKKIRFSDGPSGVRAQNGKGDCLGVNGSLPSVCYPAHSALASSWNAQLLNSVGAAIGADAAGKGIDILLAPDLNIKRNPLNGRNFEYLSEDPYLNGVLGAEYAAGVQSSGTGACLKHFAVNNREFGRMVCDSVVDGRTLRELYLTAFEIAVKRSKPAAVMTAYNKINGTYCSESALINDVLRGEWGFDGITVSDWGGTRDRSASVKAGLDIEMPNCKLSYGEVKSALDDGSLSLDDMDACVKRIIDAGNKKFTKIEQNFEELAVEAARECCVLLKNNDALPVKGEKVVLVGDLAINTPMQGGGSSKVNPKFSKSLKDCLPYKFARGYKNGKKGAGLAKKAVKLCRNADEVIYCMGMYGGDAEGADRQNIFLPENQISLLKKIKAVCRRVTVVLYCGCAVDTSWDKYADGVLLAGLLGNGGAQAVADILTGKANPSGKLAETFPKTLESLPSTEHFNQSPYYTLYREGMRVGYRSGADAAYPFGFGLSYTIFTYSDIEITDGGAGFTLTNSGDTDGAEVAQAYISFPDSANAPAMQLKGFKKVFLKAGESARVFIPFDEYSFRSYDTKNNRWATVTGEYKIFIASSSRDVRLSGALKISGDADGVAAADTENLVPSEYIINKTKKGRVVVDIHTPLAEIKCANGLFGRLFAKISLFTVRNKPTVFGSMQYLPVRTMAQFGKMNNSVTKGLITAFNGRFLKGVFTMLKKDKRKR